MNICIRCGYDLQQLPDEGSCPECGTPIEESLHGPLLAKADPHWLSRIALGQSILTWGLLLTALGSLVTILGVPVGFILINLMAGGPTLEQIFEIALMSILAGIVTGLIACGIGAVLLTMQEPKDRGRETPWSTRHCARWGMFAAAGTLWLIVALDFFRLAPVVNIALAIVLCLLTGAAVTVTVVAIVRFLSRLANRIPDEKLAKRLHNSARTLRWAIPVFTVAIVLMEPGGAGPAPAARPLPWDFVQTGLSCAFLVVGIGLIVQFVTISMAMFTFRRALRQCLRTPHDRG